MKYLIILSMLGLLIIAHAEVPIYGYFWLRYTYDNPTQPEDIEENEHYFSINRGYISWKTKTKPVSFTGTIDITNKKDATNASDWNIRLKYAQADWTLPGLGQYIPDAKLIIGLQKVYFGVVDIWTYPLVEKNLEEREKIMSSADLGIGFHGLLPSGHGEFSLQAFNGNFYTHVTENNTNKAICGNLALIPIPGVMLKGSFWVAKAPVGDTVITQVDQNRYVGLLRIQYGPVTVFGEYLVTKNDQLDGMGYSTFVEWSVTNRLNLLGRYDYFDMDTAVDDNALGVAIGGFNYKISTTLLFQANYERKMPEDETRDDSDAILCQFKVSY